MDGIAAISDRIAMIRGTLATLGPPVPAASDGLGRGPATAAAARTGALTTGTATTAAPARTTGPASADEFASVLASAVAAPTSSAAFGRLTAEQMTNAAAVVATGRGMGLSPRDQAIGVMTAMGESSLRVLDHGDAAGPDSRGLFQQRANGAWGTLAQRMDPTASATSFFSALTRVTGRDTMAPTLVAHAVQRNADPQHYTRYWDDAVAVVSRITGVSPAEISGR